MRKKKITEIKPVAPFSKDPKWVANHAFDRLTGKAVSPRDLKTYSESLGQYHLHPENKFQNADFLDRGLTVRRHVLVTDVQYIGKESNKWEQQYHLGLDPDDDIQYGAKPLSRARITAHLKKVSRNIGQRKLAEKLGISRGQLAKLLKTELRDCKSELFQTFTKFIHNYNEKKRKTDAQISELLRRTRAEYIRVGLFVFCQRIGHDPSNLLKSVNGARRIPLALIARLEKHFSGRA